MYNQYLKHLMGNDKRASEYDKVILKANIEVINKYDVQNITHYSNILRAVYTMVLDGLCVQLENVSEHPRINDNEKRNLMICVSKNGEDLSSQAFVDEIVLKRVSQMDSATSDYMDMNHLTKRLNEIDTIRNGVLQMARCMYHSSDDRFSFSVDNGFITVVDTKIGNSVKSNERVCFLDENMDVVEKAVQAVNLTREGLIVADSTDNTFTVNNTLILNRAENILINMAIGNILNTCKPKNIVNDLENDYGDY